MKFSNARCEVCGGHVFSTDDVVAYAVRRGDVEPVALNGEQPWSGVRCVCLACVRSLNQMLELKGA